MSASSAILYDGASTLYLAPGRLPPDPSVSAIFLGNGKIAVAPAVATLDCVQSMITGRVQLDRGRYDSGAISSFRYNRIRAFGDADHAVTYHTEAASLSMDTSIFSLTLSATASTTGIPLGSVSVDMYAHSSLPFCFVQTVNLTLSQAYVDAGAQTTPAQAHGADPYIMHDLYTDQTVSRVKFNTSILHVPSLSAPLYLMTGVGESDCGSGMASAAPRVVATGCCYLIESPDSLLPQGFNVYAGDRRRAYTRLTLPAAVAGRTYRFHILTATISSDDFSNPEEEVRRILLNVAGSRALPGQGPTEIASRLRADHVRAWSAQWYNSVTVAPKTMATVAEKAAVRAVQRASRFALYNLLSSTRAGARVTSDPSMLSLMDADGSLLYRGDVWFMPVLLLLRPDCARSLLDYRRKTLEGAAQLAQCYGYSGTKYGYTEDVVGYSSAVYFDSTQPQHLYNSSLIAIAVWNQFRSTSDATWLQQTGYEVLRGVSDFLVSAATPSDTVDGQYSFLNVLGYGPAPATDNVLTVATAKLALAYTIQASYVLTQLVREAWSDVLNGLVLSVNPLAPSVLVTDRSYATSAGRPVPAILDCLMPLLPWYHYSVFPHNCASYGGITIATSIAQNVAAYLPAVAAQIVTGTAHPYNVAVLAGLSAVTAQATGRAADAATFQSLLTAFIADTTDTAIGWGNFVDASRLPSSAMPFPVCDLNLASLLLFILLNCAAGVQVRGMVTDTRYFAEECRVLSLDSAVLPVTWASLTVSRVGPDMSEVRVVNSQVYASS